MLARFRLQSERARTQAVAARAGLPTRLRRRGATVVESAMVLSVFLMLLFGMFEYCRFLLVLHITNNAAREGVRYASVNMDKPTTFNTTAYTDASGNVYVSIQTYTQNMMAGVDKNIVGFEVAAFTCDQTGLNLTPPVVRPITSSVASPLVYPNPFSSSDPNALPWNTAAFPTFIAVCINGTYKPLLPSFLLMPTSIPINVYAITCPEG